ncbi:MAG TPA: transcriptional regulator [Acidimicrobiaceae bacterium]|nr:transcriptional regulator [Acidimicrobiaceae bacterium]HCV33749.1 transcriptional regulator [Acidimicrobiaceae bacterium]|tara:strand:+ start:1179 stop:1700 length:522 start_codon:yes stop_codon:yes gene_type:complete
MPSTRDDDYSMRLGERIRVIRRQKRLSLQDVEARSEAEFKASVLGAYERGERAVSVPRLHRLAEFYDVPVDQLLPSGDGETVVNKGIDEQASWMPGQKVVIDLLALADFDGPEIDLIRRYLGIIQVKRQDFNGRVLTIRQDDLQALAAILGTAVDDAAPRLAERGLLRPPASS